MIGVIEIEGPVWVALFSGSEPCLEHARKWKEET